MCYFRWHLPRAAQMRCDRERAKIFVGASWCGTGPRDVTEKDVTLLADHPGEGHSAALMLHLIAND